MTDNVTSIDGFKKRKADKAAERERNYAAIPKLVQGSALDNKMGTLGEHVRTSGRATTPPTDTSALNQEGTAGLLSQLELMEQALHELASSADAFFYGNVVTRYQPQRLLDCEDKDEFVTALRHLEASTKKAWGAYNAIRQTARAGGAQ